MSQNKSKRVCPVENAGGLESAIRKFLQNPRKILAPYVRNGMTVLDIGCGPGVFSIEMAKIVGTPGHVIAADLQEGMLQILRNKIKGTDLEDIIELSKCDAERTGLCDRVDFILAFYMVHEVPDKTNFFKEMQSLLKADGKMLIVEPKFHVSRREFDEMLESLRKMGFKIVERPKILFSRSVLLNNGD
jgi:ubiquinone/menaquinone biosynthesis C-methylase UbiE